jgi:hypothetical protein
MKRREFVRHIGLLSSLIAFSRVVRPEDEKPLTLEPRYPNHPEDKEFLIRRPGKYVLTEDIIQRQLWGAGHTGPYGTMLSIYCGSVELDLQGHVFGADFGMGGISVSATRNRDFAKSFPERYGPASLDSRFVTLRNGTVDLAHGKDTGRGIEFSSNWDDPAKQAASRPIRRIKEMGVVRDIELRDITYERNDYLFENLKVLTNALALAVEGSHTVIRNCVIESAGNACIFIAGPNVLIENCEIRLRKFDRRVGEMYSSSRQPRAAIVLRDGTNAVIRNNRIRVDYGENDPETHCILVRDGATDVLIEGNTFINVKGEPVTLTEGAQASVRDNSREQRWFPL